MIQYGIIEYSTAATISDSAVIDDIRYLIEVMIVS